MNGPAGAYKFLVYFERGAAATGGQISFNVFNPAEMPAVESEVVLWGKDEGLAKWLAEHSIRTRPFAPGQAAKRELILVGTGGGDAAAFRELAARMAQGASVVFLSPAAFRATPIRSAGCHSPKKGRGPIPISAAAISEVIPSARSIRSSKACPLAG